MNWQLDYTLTTAEERIQYVQNILDSLPQDKYINNKTLSYFSDYILFIGDRNQTKKERKENNPIITRNRAATVEKRQVSYEGLVDSLENGEDGVYAMIYQDKNQILDPRNPLSQKEIDTIPGMKDYMDTINNLQNQFAHATSGAAK